MRESHPFSPIIDENSKVLILGTFPSFKSLERGFYYSHPQNVFWRLLSDVFKEPQPNSVEEKISFLKRNKIALWDMVATCSRESSLDSSLSGVEPNDIEDLLKRYPNIERLFFTGRKAQSIFEKFFGHLDITRHYLPSPSPANRKISYQEKLKAYRSIKFPDGQTCRKEQSYRN